MEDDMCFECLEKRIQSDFSQNLIFRYGISDSALPFASRAVVQVDLRNGTDKLASEELSPQFVLVRMANCEDRCSTKCIVEKSTENGVEDHEYGKGNLGLPESCQLQAEANVGEHIGEIDSLSSSEEHPENFSTFSGKAHEVDSSNLGTRFTCDYSCSRTVTALSPIAYVGTGSYHIVENIISKYSSGSVEEHIMASLNSIIEGKPADQDGGQFLSLIGMPTFNKSNIPRHVRHPNITPILGVLKIPGCINILYPKPPYTLENILHYSPKVLKSDWHIRFLLYQLLSALAYIHALGLAHGSICPSNILLTESCWLLLNVRDKWRNQEDPIISSSKISCHVESCPCQALYADLKLSPSEDWHSDFKRWWSGEMSNFDYLLLLNRLAGRRWVDHTFHTMMPWVIDFSVKPDENSDAGWRDLRKSKWRLAKGDEQLDFTYSTSEIPHHVSDECLSELAVCSYKARRLPLSVLRSAVRSVYEPNEYPSNMQRLYQWTPDECIPEFYIDPRIFTSLHAGMSDLSVPAWATSPEEFISLHRAALESDRVSREIHHWIDITFGYQMSGQAAVEAKNVMLPTPDPMMPRSMGRRQLFTRPHPIRRGFMQCLHYSSTESTQFKSEEQEIDRSRGFKVASKVAFDSTQAMSRRLLLEIDFLKELEAATSFCDYASHLSPMYGFDHRNFVKCIFGDEERPNEHFKAEISSRHGNSMESSDIDLCSFLECLEADDSGPVSFQELLLWRHASSLEPCSEDTAGDIFSVGCILAELYLNRPLFDPTSLAAYMENGVFPGLIQELPPYARSVVEACIQGDHIRRPSARCLLESPYFPSTVRSAYLFLAPLHLLARSGTQLRYAAKFAREGALKSMGTFAAEMCAPYCLPLIMTTLSDVDADSALYLLIEFLKCLKPQSVKTLILPTIQKIVQASCEINE